MLAATMESREEAVVSEVVRPVTLLRAHSIECSTEELVGIRLGSNGVEGRRGFFLWP